MKAGGSYVLYLLEAKGITTMSRENETRVEDTTNNARTIDKENRSNSMIYYCTFIIIASRSADSQKKPIRSN